MQALPVTFRGLGSCDLALNPNVLEEAKAIIEISAYLASGDSYETLAKHSEPLKALGIEGSGWEKTGAVYCCCYAKAIKVKINK